MNGTVIQMKRKHQKTLEAIFSHPVSANIKWHDIESLLTALDAELTEREGSRVEVSLFGEVRVFHRPHPVLILIRERLQVFDNGLETMR